MKKQTTEKQYTYEQVSMVLIIIAITALWLTSTWNMDNQIKRLEHQVDSLNTEILYNHLINM